MINNGKEILHFGNLSLDIKNRLVFVDEEELKLTRKEFDMLSFFATNTNLHDTGVVFFGIGIDYYLVFGIIVQGHEPENITFKIYAGDEPLKINSIQLIPEYHGDDQPGRGFFLPFERPKKRPEKYCIFRIGATYNAFGGEKGENVYFYEMKDYQ
ncbi:hypothetical protein FACS1894177_07300 [Bacteroidia bacterium]|nr:hypothetical protein FACS1894177_07300 [Bacteroidia bacterium]